MSTLLPPWKILSDLIAAGNGDAVTQFIETLSPPETARTISRLSEEEQHGLFGLLSPEDAADVIEDIPEIHHILFDGWSAAIILRMCWGKWMRMPVGPFWRKWTGRKPQRPGC